MHTSFISHHSINYCWPELNSNILKILVKLLMTRYISVKSHGQHYDCVHLYSRAINTKHMNKNVLKSCHYVSLYTNKLSEWVK